MRIPRQPASEKGSPLPRETSSPQQCPRVATGACTQDLFVALLLECPEQRPAAKRSAGHRKPLGEFDAADLQAKEIEPTGDGPA
jgi:hypothetical protein